MGCPFVWCACENELLYSSIIYLILYITEAGSFFFISKLRLFVIMFCSKDSEIINVKMDDNAVKQVPKFKYLGSAFTEDGKIK